jgi:hypothetical protein
MPLVAMIYFWVEAGPQYRKAQSLLSQIVLHTEPVIGHLHQSHLDVLQSYSRGHSANHSYFLGPWAVATHVR